MKIKLKNNQGDHHDEVKFTIGATRTELYSLVVAISAAVAWLCRHGFFG